jgi:diguanylate cyclase (GGDEF)-like protein
MQTWCKACEGRLGISISAAKPARSTRNCTRNRPRFWYGLACVAAIVLTVAVEAWADDNQMRFGRLTVEDGLSNGSVLAMLQDERGFLWFGTEAGLNRYDGHTFVTYRYDPEVPGSLPHDYILGLAEDANGDIWIATDGGGLGRWDHLTDSFVSLTKESTAPDGLVSNAVRVVTIDAQGLLWIGTRDGGLQGFDPITGRWRSFRHDPEDPTSLGSDSVYSIWIDGDGTLWIGTDGGLGRLDPATGLFTNFRSDPDESTSLSDNWVRSVVRDRRGDLWVGTWHGGLNRFDESTGGFTHYVHDPDDPSSLGNNRVRTVFEDQDGRLWVGTIGGLSRFSDDRDGFSTFRHSNSEPASLSWDDVTVVAEDRGGILWIGTQGGGLSKWNPATVLFGHVAANAEMSGRLNNGNVTSFSDDGAGRLWVGTYGGGLNIMDRATGGFSRKLPGLDSLDRAISSHVMALLHDQQGVAWIGTADRGVFRWDPRTGALTNFRHDPDDPSSLGADSISSMFEDQLRRLWVGTFGGGLNLFEPSTGTFVRFQHDPTDPTTLSAPWITCISQAPGDLLWVGTHTGGLNLFDPSKGNARRFAPDPDDPSSLGSDTVVALHLEPTGRLWLATRGRGLGTIEQVPNPGESARFTTYTTANGLPSNTIYGIQMDGDGRLWLSSDSGIARFDPTDGSVRSYGTDHGLQGRDFNFGAHYKSPDGQLFFGGVNGFNAFYPRQLEEIQRALPVVLTSVLKFNQPVTEYGPPYLLDEIELSYRDDMVTFEFAALDFSAPSRILYAYMLEGFHDDWIKLGNIHRVTFTDLDDGAYVLRVRAANNDGVWNENVMSLVLRVAPPWWRTWWAYLLYLAAAIFVIVSFGGGQRLKLRRQEEYSHRLELEVEERTQELAQRNLDLEAANNKLVEASLTDSLTGLRNRRYLFEEVAKEISLVRRQHREAAAGIRTADLRDIVFIMIDLDNFKPINDTFGHPAGDRVLIQLRDVLLEACRTSDMVIRWGGDEFLIVGRDVDADTAETLAERIRTGVNGHPFALDNGQILRTTASVGFACYPFLRSDPERFDWQQVLAVADFAQYVSKKSSCDAFTGILSTPTSAEVDDLFRMVREEPDRLADEGRLEIRTSLPPSVELVFHHADEPRPRVEASEGGADRTDSSSGSSE